MSTTRRRRLDATKALPEVVRRLLAITDPDELLARVLELCREALGADEVSLLLVDEDDLVEAEVRGKTLRKQRFRLRIGEEGVAGIAAAHRQTIVVPDVRLDKRYKKVSADTRSEACVPIVAGERLLGVLNFESSKIGFFSHTDRHLLELLAAQIALGLRLDEARRRADRLATELGMLNHLGRAGTMLDPRLFLQRCCDAVRRAFDCIYVGIFFGDYSKERLVLLAHATTIPLDFGPGESQAFGKGMIGHAFKFGETHNARDVRKDPYYTSYVESVLSEVDVPIRAGDHCLGIVDAQAATVGAFSQDEVQTLETLARFLVPMLQHASMDQLIQLGR